MPTAHVHSRTQGAGVFHHLDALSAGDAVLFRRDGAPQLALITCDGAFDESSRHHRDNIVVLAVPVA